MKRLLALSIAALVCPAALTAQQPAPQQQANPIAQSFAAASSLYGRWLVAAFDSIPAGKYDYRPTPVQQTVGYVAQHLEEANYGLCARFGGPAHAATAKDSLADTVKARWPKDTLVARLRASLAYCDAAIAGVSDAQLTDQIHVGPPTGGRTIPRARFLVGYSTDLAEHYAQLASYMRMMGMVPPSALPRPRQ